MSALATDSLEAAIERRLAELAEANPLRLFTIREVRKIIFGDDVTDDQRPTELWIKRQVRAGVLDCTRFGTAIWMSVDDIRTLLRVYAKTRHGVPKYKDPRKK